MKASPLIYSDPVSTFDDMLDFSKCLRKPPEHILVACRLFGVNPHIETKVHAAEPLPYMGYGEFHYRLATRVDLLGEPSIISSSIRYLSKKFRPDDLSPHFILKFEQRALDTAIDRHSTLKGTPGWVEIHCEEKELP